MAWAQSSERTVLPDTTLGAAEQAAAYRAFFEYMPIRDQAVSDDPWRTYRRFQYGATMTFFFLDERQYREPSGEILCQSNPDPFGIAFGEETEDLFGRRPLRAAFFRIQREVFDPLPVHGLV